MKKFKPQSPNPSIRKPADASLAVLGQLNEIVDQKADNENFTTYLYDWYFTVFPSMIKTGDTITDIYSPSNPLKTYKIKGTAWIDTGYSYYNGYFGTVYYPSACEYFDISKSDATVVYYDYNDQSLIPNPLVAGCSIWNSDLGTPTPLEEAYIGLHRSEYNGNVYYDIFLRLLASDPSASLQGEVSFELTLNYGDGCDNKKELTYFFD